MEGISVSVLHIYGYYAVNIDSTIMRYILWQYSQFLFTGPPFSPQKGVIRFINFMSYKSLGNLYTCSTAYIVPVVLKEIVHHYLSRPSQKMMSSHNNLIYTTFLTYLLLAASTTQRGKTFRTFMKLKPVWSVSVRQN